METRRSRRLNWRWLLLPLGLLLLIGVVFWRLQTSAATPAVTATGTVSQGDLTLTVTGSGSVQPARTLDLPFQASGQVSEVLVKVGDHVTKGQPLARLDDRDLQLQVQQAQANLKTAQAKLEQTKTGAATPQDIAQAQAGVNGAQAQLQKARTGNTTAADIQNAQAAVTAANAKLQQTQHGNATPSDIANAQASLQAAQAKLDALKNPSPDKVSTAQTKLTQAQTALAKTQADDAAAKVQANQNVDKAADSVRLAQQAYSDTFWNNQQAQDGKDPKTGKSFDSENLDKGVQQRQYQSALENATLQLNQAQAALDQAKVAYENSKQQEITDIQQAQAQVDDAQKQLDALNNPSQTDVVQAQAQVDQAQAQLDKLRSGGTASDVTIARSNLAQAQAQLNKLRQGGTPADIAAAKSQVDQANASLEKLTAPAAQPDIETAEAGVDQAQAAVDAAKLKLDQATLVAPFDGVVATVNIVPGSSANGGGSSSSTSSSTSSSGGPITLVDRSSMHIDLNLSESDVARVQADQPVTITLDALPGTVLSGKVESIAPSATVQQNVTTYLVQVTFDPGSAPIKVGMSAAAEIQVQQIKDAILVPSRAVQTSGTNHTVTVLQGPQRAPVPVQVETGATSNGQTEITSCVDTGAQCLRPGDVLALPTVTTGTATQGANRAGGGARGGFGIPFGR